MTRRLLASYLSIAAFVLLVLEVPLAITYARSEVERLTRDLERDATVLASLAEDLLEQDAANALQPTVEDYARRTGARALVTDAEGITVADSDPAFPPPRDVSTRPEVEEALAGRRTSGARASATLGEDLRYVAVPVLSAGGVHGAVRLTYPGGALAARITQQRLALVGIAVVVLLGTALVGVRIAQQVARPARALQRTVAAVAAGDLEARAPEDDGPQELRALAGHLNAMATQLGATLEAQRAFVADASHQLRSPLTAVRLELDNLVDAVEAPDVRDAVERVAAEVARLTSLVEGLLVLARDDGRLPAPVGIDASAVVRERAAFWEPLAAERAVEVTVVGADAPAPARAVPGALEQVVDNLVANALEVAPAGTPVELRVERGTVGGEVVVTVADRGPGMTEEERVRAFDRFWQGRRRTGGSGLGLAIAQRLASASGGSVRLRAADGGGLAAEVRVPAGVVDAASSDADTP